MKSFLLVLLLSCSSCLCLAQLQDGDKLLSLRMGYLNIVDFNPTFYGGLDFEIMVSDRVGIQYSLLFGKDYFHMPLAPLAGIYTGIAVGNRKARRDSTSRGIAVGALVFLLTAAIPEGVSYSLPVNDKISFVPYINPFQFEVVHFDHNDRIAYAGGSLGMRYLHSFGGDWMYSIYGEYKIHYYKDLHPGFTAGWRICRLF